MDIEAFQALWIILSFVAGFEKEDDQWLVKVCKNMNEFIDTFSRGYEYVTGYGELKICRKRK